MLKVAKELAEGSGLLLFRVLVIPQKLLHAFAHDLLLRGLVVRLVHSSTCVCGLKTRMYVVQCEGAVRGCGGRDWTCGSWISPVTMITQID